MVTPPHPHSHLKETARQKMSKFAKNNQVRVRATKFDGEGDRDELGLTFSEKWLRDGNGEWCYGKISFVYKKKKQTATEIQDLVP